MHELSIVMGVIQVAEEEARKAGGAGIEELELDIGCLSTIEMNAFGFAWQQAVKTTLLEKTVLKVNRPEGRACCIDCDTVFPMQQLYDPCPVCGHHRIMVIQGKELRVKSLVLA